jgi:type I restriction enzyme S subunit
LSFINGNLNTSIIANIPFVLPPDLSNDQRMIAIKCAFAKQAKNERESETLAALRDTLLPKLLSGELRVGDAQSELEMCNGN